MSKAFTRESDDLVERPVIKQSTLPPGVTNYFTPQGLRNLQRELEQLDATSPSARPRISEIQRILQTAVAVEPPPPPWNQVLFGATATVRNQHGEEMIYRIVGADETDLNRDHISWLSPIAKALLKARIGDRVRFRAPAGEQELEIIKVQYETEA